MSRPRKPLKPGVVPNRSRGNRSPLDRLPEDVQNALLRKCMGTSTYSKILTWLRAAHGLQIGASALCAWRLRRIAESAPTNTKTLRAGGFEIEIATPGASAITVRVTPAGAVEGRE